MAKGICTILMVLEPGQDLNSEMAHTAVCTNLMGNHFVPDKAWTNETMCKGMCTNFMDTVLVPGEDLNGELARKIVCTHLKDYHFITSKAWTNEMMRKGICSNFMDTILLMGRAKTVT